MIEKPSPGTFLTPFRSDATSMFSADSQIGLRFVALKVPLSGSLTVEMRPEIGLSEHSGMPSVTVRLVEAALAGM